MQWCQDMGNMAEHDLNNEANKVDESEEYCEMNRTEAHLARDNGLEIDEAQEHCETDSASWGTEAEKSDDAEEASRYRTDSVVRDELQSEPN